MRDHYIPVNSPEAFEICKIVRDRERARMGLIQIEEMPKPKKHKQPPGKKAFYSDP